MNMLAFALQEGATPQSDHHLLMIFIGMVSIALVIQAICVIVVAIVLASVALKLKGVSGEIYEHVLPIVNKTSLLVDSISPKVTGIATNVERISETLHARTAEIGETVSQLTRTVDDVNLRARQHVVHADRIVGSALADTAEFKDTLANGIRVPLRQVTGLMAGLRAGVETLITRTPGGRKRGPAPVAPFRSNAAPDVPIVLITEE